MADGILTIDTKIDQSGAEKDMKGLGGKLSSAMGTIGKGVAVAGTAVVASVGAVAGAIGGVATKTAEYGDNIDKMSQKMGMSAEKYQEWDFIMQHSGTSMDSMQASMKTLANAVESGNEAFETLGITEQELANMSQEEIFERTISELQNVEDTTQRTYLAGKLLGRGATELGALLNTSSDDVEAMKKQVHDLGGVMSDDAVKASAQFQDSLQNLQYSFNGLKNTATADFLPSIVQMMDGLSKVLSGDDSGFADLENGITEFMDKLSNALPEILSIAESIVMSLANALIQNLPQIMTAGGQIIGDLIKGIVSALPLVLQTAMSLIQTLGSGLASSLPALIPQAVNTILKLCDYLLENVDMLIDVSVDLMVGLATGLANSIPILLEKAPLIIAKLYTALANNAPKILEAGVEIAVAIGKGLITGIPKLISNVPTMILALVNAYKSLGSYMLEVGSVLVKMIADGLRGAWSIVTSWAGSAISSLVGAFNSAIGTVASVGTNIVQGIWNGISNGYSWITGKIKGWVSSVLDYIKSVFGIHSPSTLMRDEVGKYLAQGIGVGFEEENPFTNINKTVSAGISGIRANLDGGLAMSLNGGVIDYQRLGNAVADGMASANLGLSIGEREFGRIIRKETVYA